MIIHRYRNHRRLFSALESQLNVDRVYNENRNKNETGIFDNLYQGIQTRIEEDKAKAKPEDSMDMGDETSVDAPDASTSETDDASSNTESEVTDNTDPDNTETKDEKDPTPSSNQDPDKDDVGLESFLNNHVLALEEFVSLENDFYSSHHYTSKLVDAFKRVKDIGFKYGPILLKHVYKGVVGALNLVFKTLVNSTVLISKLSAQYRHSYEDHKERIAELKKAVELINEGLVDPPDNNDRYGNGVIIKKLASRNSVDFLSLANEVLKFNTVVFDFSMKEMTNNVNGTLALIQMAMSSNVKAPSGLMTESTAMPGLVSKRIPGYDFSDAYVESYVHNVVLPGNILFIGHFPKKALTSREDILEAYKDAKVFMGYDEEHSISDESVEYLGIEDISNYLNILDQLCDIGLKENEKLDRILKIKRNIKIKLSLYLKYLAAAKEKVSIEDSLAEYIGLKIKYFDNVYIKGSNAVYEYNTHYIANSLTYLTACLKRYT